MWDEVKRAKDENRRELVLTGKTLQTRISGSDGKLDPELFNLANLNFLDLSNSGTSKLDAVPDDIGKLKELATLIVSGVGLEGSVPEALQNCSKLKVFI